MLHPLVLLPTEVHLRIRHQLGHKSSPYHQSWGYHLSNSSSSHKKALLKGQGNKNSPISPPSITSENHPQQCGSVPTDTAHTLHHCPGALTYCPAPLTTGQSVGKAQIDHFDLWYKEWTVIMMSS